ncbi:beta-1,4-xylosyltransferase IRX9 [Diospyros lotus]|uniref:beta-1,4-xylosyltransferase IRX9 n=1 Tax=Diospyros lotus TaxID=55363 RepID=UPI00225422B0|nr:beta-1,4-xylosyltransferase IRX9 [Diospyros lotus]
MGSMERSKKKVQLYKKAIVHFLLCFVMGFFTGFAPSAKPSIPSSPVSASNRPAFSPLSMEAIHQGASRNGSLTPHPEPQRRPDESEAAKGLKEEEGEAKEDEKLVPGRQIIVVTPTSSKDEFRVVHLRRLANTLRLVPPPFLWIVVEQKTESSEMSEVLRKTGIMYRHLVFKENFTHHEAEMDHQRNLALNHIELHRLNGIVHFAGLSNVYDLSFFHEIRAIEVFGTWPMALLSANRNKVRIQGPVCDSSEVVGWHLKKMNNQTDDRPPVHISSFAFNSSILWDPERWGRPSSVPSTKQNTIKFVKKEIQEGETKLIGIPAGGCSKIMLWSVHSPRRTENIDNS